MRRYVLCVLAALFAITAIVGALRWVSYPLHETPVDLKIATLASSAFAALCLLLAEDNDQ